MSVVKPRLTPKVVPGVVPSAGRSRGGTVECMFGQSSRHRQALQKAQITIDAQRRRIRDLEALVEQLSRRADVGEAELSQLQRGVTSDIPQEVRDLVQSGRLIEAIKSYREHHPGVGLKEAKDAVEAYRDSQR